jgi:hypothetical protein
MKEKTLAIIGLFFAMGLLITLSTLIAAWVFKGAF